jgi:hypothetical protein
MSWNGWDTDPNGDIAVFPVTGWSTVTFMNGIAGGLRIEFATDPSLKNQSANQLDTSIYRLRARLQAGREREGGSRLASLLAKVGRFAASRQARAG